jgi:catechol 2,3-dioxygenase-like lactoylglutathione lyase family enzyme
MAVQFNHTIAFARDNVAAATFLAEMLDTLPPTRYGPFMVVEDANGASIDFMNADEPTWAHYAFLVTEPEFDEIFGRIRERELPYWADPHKNEPGAINTNDGGRGVYFEDPDGHLLEAITRPYGVGA